jgi:hypothetical protein
MKQLYSLFLTVIKYDTSGLNLQVFVETNRMLRVAYMFSLFFRSLKVSSMGSNTIKRMRATDRHTTPMK